MKTYTKPAVLVERFSVTESLANCNAMRLNFMDTKCVLDSPNATDEMKGLALMGFFMTSGGCPQQATDGALCFITSANMAFTS